MNLKPKWNAVIIEMRSGYGEESNGKVSGTVKANENWGDLFIKLMSVSLWQSWITLVSVLSVCSELDGWRKSWFLIIEYLTRSFSYNRSAADLWVEKRNKCWLPNNDHIAFPVESKGWGLSPCKINIRHCKMEGLWSNEAKWAKGVPCFFFFFLSPFLYYSC